MNRLLAFFSLLLLSCTRYGQAPIPATYQESLTEWMQNRHQSLTNPTGWLRLSDMIWLENGTTSFLGGEVERRDSLVFHADTLIFNGMDSPIVSSGTYRWRIIERSGLLGIRIWNTENPQVDAFTGFDRYPTDTTFIRNAQFRANPPGTTIPVVNVLGILEDIASPGVLEFDLDGRRMTLNTLNGGNDQYFVIFGDPTNRTDTYQAGRFVYVAHPKQGTDRTVIDFNKAYNPPCSFSEYTTCQLPPEGNLLSIAILAGEKRPD